jgi:hypothetical protein
LFGEYLRLLDARDDGASYQTLAKQLYPRDAGAGERVRKRLKAAGDIETRLPFGAGEVVPVYPEASGRAPHARVVKTVRPLSIGMRTHKAILIAGALIAAASAAAGVGAGQKPCWERRHRRSA